MRRCPFAFVIGVTAVVSTAAIAAAPPTNVLFAGTVDRGYVQGSSGGFVTLCIIDGAQSTFIRKTSPVVARLISLPDINVTPKGSVGPEAFTLGGQAQMTFDLNNPRAGRIAFAPVAGYPPTMNKPRFTQYSEDYDVATATLTVSFTIRFDYCELPITATYRN